MRILFVGIIILLTQSVFAQSGIQGVISNTKGEILPFSTIYIEETTSGTASNQNGVYQLDLKPGLYTLNFKYLGYKTLKKEVEVKSGYKTLNIELEPQTVLLKEVVTTASGADPANYIMRKVIARSAYHKQIIDSSFFEVYVKGKGKITEIPFLLERTLKKEGIEEGSILITESVSEVYYKRPNQYTEKVISVYASKETDIDANPMPFIAGSFYDNYIANSVSPAGSKAFKYYNFKHMGAFTDEGHLINKIKVIPKVDGPNMFKGVIHIVEEDWSLYYVDLNTQIELGIKINVKQNYEKIQDAVWQPITYEFDVEASPMGFGFEFKYFASVSDYTIQLNPVMLSIVEPTQEKNKKAQSKSQLSETENSKEERMIEELEAYQKQQRDSIKEQEIMSVRSYSIDSMAYKRDSSYWNTLRPIPLTKEEKIGYVQRDSLSSIQAEKDKKDSVKSVNRSTFQAWDILTGGSYSISKDNSLKFKIYSPLLGINFNTVEGLNFNYSIGLKKNLPVSVDSSGQYVDGSDLRADRFLLFKPTLRYGFARQNTVLGKLLLRYKNKDAYLNLEAGDYVRQFNDLPAVTPILNTNFSLIWEQNFMKIYQSRYAKVKFETPLNRNFTIEGDIEYEQRKRLFNNSDYSVFDWRREYTPNLPVNTEIVDDFDGQNAFTSTFRLSFKPKTRYYVRNNVKYEASTDDLRIGLSLYSGFGLFNSDVSYQRLEVDYKDRYSFGEKGTTFVNFVAGSFLNNSNLGFMDYAHFPGNLSFITQADPVRSYRLLEYYRFSTDNYYVQTFLYHQFRKLLISQIPVIRFMGIKENVFINHLQTAQSNNYTELGYSIDGIFNIFRLEFATSYEDFSYKDWGIRIGIATTLGGAVSVDMNSDE